MARTTNFLFTNLFSITFLYFFIISSLFPYFNLFVSIFIQSYINNNLHVSTPYLNFWNFSDPIVEVNAVVRHFLIFGAFLTLSLKLMQWYVISVIRGSLNEKFGNKKCVKILKFWRTELSYAQNKRGCQEKSKYQ